MRVGMGYDVHKLVVLGVFSLLDNYRIKLLKE